MTNRKYFYKEVENALYRLSECYADIEKSTSANTEIPQMQIISALMEVFNDFKWSKHELVAHLNLQENELTDEDKEKIAISNKEDLQELINVVDEQIKFFGAYKDTCHNIMLASNTLNTLINEFAIDQLSYDFLDENNDPELNLTDEELYYALLFFDKEQVRRLLSSQTPKTFNILYQSFLRGKSDFLDALNGLEYTMIPSLRNALKAKMEEQNESCFTKFDMSDLPLLKLLADEVCEDDDILFVIDQLEALQRGEILNIEAFNIDSINKFLHH